MSKITATKVGMTWYDDGESTRELEEEFKSTVYSSVSDYLHDILICAQNDNFLYAPIVVPEEHSFPRRSPKEREEVIISKAHATRRLQEHDETGGTDIFGGDLSGGDILDDIPLH